jgi:hypothetical protein
MELESKRSSLIQTNELKVCDSTLYTFGAAKTTKIKKSNQTFQKFDMTATRKRGKEFNTLRDATYHHRHQACARP